MMPGRGCPDAIVLGLALISAGSWPTSARGDGGALRAWKEHGAYTIAVFTEPSPVVIGPVDISVLLLDRKTGEPITGAQVMVEVLPVGRPAGATRHPATIQAATNKLLRAAVFELRDTGRCEVNVDIDGPDDHAEIQFELDVGSSWSLRTGVWPWILWPLPVIASYGVHRRLVDRAARRGRNAYG
jgi:hypothetical protein